MFTGIIRNLGEIKKIEKEGNSKIFLVTVEEKFLKDLKIGDSIALNGTCITVTKLLEKEFQFQAIQETLKKTNLNNLESKDIVNLEKSLKIGDSLDGHFVQGHVDETGEVLELKANKAKNNFQLKVQFSEKLKKFIAPKGSITIDGVSLTICEVQDDQEKNHCFFTVELIDHTYKNTNFQSLKSGDKVNLEIDVIARYLNQINKFK